MLAILAITHTVVKSYTPYVDDAIIATGGYDEALHTPYAVYAITPPLRHCC